MAGGSAKFLKSKPAKTALLLGACLLLLLLVYLVFFSGEKKTGVEAGYTPTEREARLARLLEEVEGVGSVTAMITEQGGEAVGAIVVFCGADSILTRMRVLDITAAALHCSKQNVQVYPAVK